MALINNRKECLSIIHQYVILRNNKLAPVGLSAVHLCAAAFQRQKQCRDRFRPELPCEAGSKQTVSD